MSNNINIGRLLRSNITGCVIGCRVGQQSEFEFGSMIQIPLNDQSDTILYGIIYDMHIDDDGLVKQLVAAENVSEEVILDNRLNRNVPIEISVLYIGYETNSQISHLLPPKPPLVLDAIKKCEQNEIVKFTEIGRFGYFRHILAVENAPVEEVIAAHLKHADLCHKQVGNSHWLQEATQELIILLRDDYSTLMRVLSALSDI